MSVGREGSGVAAVRPSDGLNPAPESIGTSEGVSGPLGADSAIPFHVIVTGSREWPSARTVWAALDAVAAKQAGHRLVVRHGACRTGADAHAAVWCRRAIDAGWDVVEEQHPADWARHGNAAGPLRNREMVQAGAQLVLAFLGPGPSRGTRGTIALAVGAGIPVRRYEHPAVTA